MSTPADDAGMLDRTCETLRRYFTAARESEEGGPAVYEAEYANQILDEARAEADRLRAEVERLTVHREGIREQCDELAVKVNRLRVTLGKVAAESQALLDFLANNGFIDDGHFNPPTEAEALTHMARLSDALILSADVSDADVRACGHRFPDGTACTLTDHSAPGLAELHGSEAVSDRG